MYYSPNFYGVCAIDDFIFCANIKKVLDLLCRVVYQSKRSIDDAYRGIAQLVEHRSPKPSVEGSNPSAPANNQKAVRKGGFLVIEQKVKVRNRQEGSMPKRKASGSAPVSNKRMSEKEQALRSNGADNLSAPANQDEDALMRLFSF